MDATYQPQAFPMRELEQIEQALSAAQQWTEALTLLSETGAPDEVYADVAHEFAAEEQVALTLAIIAINSWNRLAVGFRQPVGAYVSKLQRVPA